MDREESEKESFNVTGQTIGEDSVEVEEWEGIFLGKIWIVARKGEEKRRSFHVTGQTTTTDLVYLRLTLFLTRFTTLLLISTLFSEGH